MYKKRRRIIFNATAKPPSKKKKKKKLDILFMYERASNVLASYTRASLQWVLSRHGTVLAGAARFWHLKNSRRPNQFNQQLSLMHAQVADKSVFCCTHVQLAAALYVQILLFWCWHGEVAGQEYNRHKYFVKFFKSREQKAAIYSISFQSTIWALKIK